MLLNYSKLTHSQVRVWSRSIERATKLCNAIDLPSKPCETVEEAVNDADIIVTATFADKPVLKKEWVKEGAHINGMVETREQVTFIYIGVISKLFLINFAAVGACRADWQEIDSKLMTSAVVYVDTRDACLKEAGDIILSEVQVFRIT